MPENYQQAARAWAERAVAHGVEIDRLNTEIERLRAALLKIASGSRWSKIELDSEGASMGAAIVAEMQTVARRALAEL